MSFSARALVLALIAQALPFLARAEGDLQTSLTLDRSLVQFAMFSDGQGTSVEAGQTPSQVSYNNFINYCALRPDLPLTNGQQQPDVASCSSTPQGQLAPRDKMPHAKFVFPFNTAVLPARTTFTLRLAVRNLATGFFANPDVSFHAAPQELDPGSGLVRGHSHVVVQRIESMASTTPIHPKEFVFFKGLNSPANDKGELITVIDGGLEEGVYRLACINAATNHQPALVGIAQRGTLDDAVYFEVKAGVPMPTSP
ncbi:hypothetical protein BKA62DRAFT_687299 [Auriculariales sp. MPI-PUGE-AT-0066]|nr:hypothetical protein BKA62DRAFT_687299 [Auriculariales sp. MPI-PUGE-AT-0066]